MGVSTPHPRAVFEAAHKAYTDAFAYFEALPAATTARTRHSIGGSRQWTT